MCLVMVEVDLVGAAGVVSVVRTVTSEEFGPGAVAAGAVESDAVGSDEGVELLKAVSLFVSAFEAQERFGVGRAMLREFDEVASVQNGRGVSTSVITGFGATR